MAGRGLLNITVVRVVEPVTFELTGSVTGIVISFHIFQYWSLCLQGILRDVLSSDTSR